MEEGFGGLFTRATECTWTDWAGSHSPLSPDSTSKAASSSPEGGALRLYGYVCFYCHASLQNLACTDIKIVRARQKQENKTKSRSYSSQCSTSSDPWPFSEFDPYPGSNSSMQVLSTCAPRSLKKISLPSVSEQWVVSLF